uniref:Pentapeptide repeat-containing protein n=1 Tax=viral metagenome TaxID=1070528 RepID=A0A6C0KFA3_9ZZZZ
MTDNRRSSNNFRFNRPYRVASPFVPDRDVGIIDLKNMAGGIIQVGIVAADTIADVKRFISTHSDRCLGIEKTINWTRISLVHLSESGEYIQLDDTSMASIADGKEVNIVVKDLRIINDIQPNSNMRYTNLIGHDLSDADIRGVDFTGVNLIDSNLTGADLSGANLTRAKLESSVLSLSNLTGADLTHADLTHANLTGADLTYANLREANLKSADLTGVDLTNVNLSNAKNVDQRYLQ